MSGKKLMLSVDPSAFDASFDFGYSELAELSGVSERTIRRIRKEGTVTLDTGLRLCMALRKPVREIFGRQADESDAGFAGWALR